MFFLLFVAPPLLVFVGILLLLVSSRRRIAGTVMLVLGLGTIIGLSCSAGDEYAGRIFALLALPSALGGLVIGAAVKFVASPFEARPDHEQTNVPNVSGGQSLPHSPSSGAEPLGSAWLTSVQPRAQRHGDARARGLFLRRLSFVCSIATCVFIAGIAWQNHKDSSEVLTSPYSDLWEIDFWSRVYRNSLIEAALAAMAFISAVLVAWQRLTLSLVTSGLVLAALITLLYFGPNGDSGYLGFPRGLPVAGGAILLFVSVIALIGAQKWNQAPSLPQQARVTSSDI